MGRFTKVLFIGLDACDKFLLQSWANDGTLVNFRSLLDEGLSGDTMSLTGLYEGSTWPSFYTGVSPARHGFHRLVQLRPGTYELYTCLPGERVQYPPFWDYLSRANKKVAVLDIPLAHLSAKINGMQVVEWGSHDAAYGFHASSGMLKNEIISRFGAYPVKDTCDSFGSSGQLVQLRDLLLRGIEQKTKLTLSYLDQGNWDFFGQVFTEAHCMGHQSFHLHDPDHPSHDPEVAARTGNLLRDVYVAIDHALGQILKAVGTDTVVIALASHRMSHNFGANFLFNEILIRIGAATRLPPSPSVATNTRSFITIADRMLGYCWRQLPPALKETLTPIKDHLRKQFDNPGPPSLLSLGLDLSKSRCFPLQNGNSVSGIRLNQAGRESGGILSKKDCESFCDELTGDLLAIRDGDSGKPIFKNIWRTAEIFQGEGVVHLPDLLVEWNDEVKIGSAGTGSVRGSTVRLTSEKIGKIEGTYNYCRTGDHRPEGLFVAKGPGIVQGHKGNTHSIMDFAPTIASLLGVDLPDVDGRPIQEILAARSSLP